MLYEVITEQRAPIVDQIELEGIGTPGFLVGDDLHRHLEPAPANVAKGPAPSYNFV